MSKQSDYYRNLSPVAEAVRGLRTNLIRIFSENHWKTLVVTAAEPGGGATTVSLELARSLVRNGEKVLLVDANLRIPALAERMELESDQGLTDVLAEVAAFQDVIVRKNDEPDLLHSGTVAENPSELLGSEAMKKLLNDEKINYDYVIIDTPPAALVADASIISSRAEATILVVEEGVSDKSTVRQAIDTIEKAGGNLIGAVMNKSQLE